MERISLLEIRVRAVERAHVHCGELRQRFDILVQLVFDVLVVGEDVFDLQFTGSATDEMLKVKLAVLF